MTHIQNLHCERCPAIIARAWVIPVFGPHLGDTPARSELFPGVCVTCEEAIQSDIESRGQSAQCKEET